jgi:Tfp pilus assembly protein PilX
MRRLAREEGGWALVTAIVVMAAMLSLGLGAMVFIDGQTQQTGSERVGESSFNLAEGALKSQIFLLSRDWPGSPTSAYSPCTQASTSSECPSPATLAAEFSGADYEDVTWSTAVQDNGGSVASYYSTSGAAGQPGYDANGDGKVWVHAEANLRSPQAATWGKPRAVAALIKADLVPLPFPRNTVTAGFFGTTNAGSKTIADTSGSSVLASPTQPAPIAVRCSTPPQSACLNFDPTKGQVSPPAYDPAYPGTSALTTEEVETLRGLAKAAHTYYETGCPADPSGALVFVESGNCSYNGGNANSQASPGMLVIANGTLTLGGNFTFYGLVYALNQQEPLNQQGPSGNVVTLGGTSSVVGAVAVDGWGGVLAGSSGLNVAFDPNVFNLVKGYGNAAWVKGTWRELVN